MNRRCYLCNSEIFECMGSVHAGSFIDFMSGSFDKIYELCPKCASKYASSNLLVCPQPSDYSNKCLKE